MIYRNSYFKKEVRQAYLDNSISQRRKLLFALFVGLFSFAFYFVLQTLKESVLSDAVPEIMQPSFFSTLTIYNTAVSLAAALYFIVYYDYLFFSEIRRNAWYLLIQMGYRPAKMISEKIVALLHSALLIYTIGFASTSLLTVFLKFSFVFAYMPALFIAGLADIVLLTSLSAAISLAVKSRGDARILIGGALILILMLKAVTGAYAVLSNRVVMQNINNLLDINRSWYYPAAATLVVACLLLTALRARRLAQYYSVSGRAEPALPAGVAIVYMNEATGRQKSAARKPWYVRRRTLLNAAVTSLLAALILAALTLNVLIILISTATPGNEVTIRGTIPYIFGSDTMQPSIMVNDLVFFRKIDAQYPLSEGDIVLFRDNNIVYVERVTKVFTDGLEVDIDHYPAAAEAGAMIKQVSRSAVYGLYSDRSRWLGALILFANTIIGRVLFLLVPAVLLFYRKRIAALHQRSRES